VGIIKSAAAGRDRIHFALPSDLGAALLDEVSRERRAYELFNQAVLEGRLEDKIRLYRAAIKLDPSLFEVRYNLALTLEKTGRRTTASACCSTTSTAIAAGPRSTTGATWRSPRRRRTSTRSASGSSMPSTRSRRSERRRNQDGRPLRDPRQSRPGRHGRRLSR